MTDDIITELQQEAETTEQLDPSNSSVEVMRKAAETITLLRQTRWLPPWQRPELVGWRIVGMNHYMQSSCGYLYIAMTKGIHCIQVEGPDGPALWDELVRRVELVKESRWTKEPFK